MNREHLIITIARTFSEAERLSQIDFHDADLNALRDDLYRFASSIHSIPRSLIDSGNREIISSDAEAISLYIHCLMNSLGVTINKEMEYVVRRLAAYWNIDMSKNVLVFARGDYAVRHLIFDKLGVNVLEKRCRVKFAKEPRIVYLPQFYDGDMLFNSILYHEVGHMVERDNSIAEVIYVKIEDLIKNKPTCKIINNYFKKLVEKRTTTEEEIKEHIKEYVADVFGCQYLGEHILEYVNYRESSGRNLDREDHPTYACRERLVNSMVKYMQNPALTINDGFLEMIVQAFKNTSSIDELRQRCILHPTSYIYQGSAVPLNNDEELFSIFTAAWDVALSGIIKMEQIRKMPAGSMTTIAYYQLINDAVRLSIQNFMATH